MRYMPDWSFIHMFNFDGLKNLNGHCSQRTVQYFPSVYTKVTNEVEFNFCQRFYHIFAHVQLGATLVNPLIHVITLYNS